MLPSFVSTLYNKIIPKIFVSANKSGQPRTQADFIAFVGQLLTSLQQLEAIVKNLDTAKYNLQQLTKKAGVSLNI